MLSSFASRLTPLSSRASRASPALRSLLPPSPFPLPLQTRTFASKKHKRIVKAAKGYKGRANKIFSVAIQRVEKALQHAYIGRKLKKRNFRRSWIESINAGVRQYGLRYSEFLGNMKGSGLVLNRKVVADLARYEPFSFKAVLDVVAKTGGKGV